LPYLKKKYLKYADYQHERIENIFGADQLERAVKGEAKMMESSVLINKGDGTFIVQALPKETQLSPVYGIGCEDYDGDGKADILLGGNFYESKPEAGIYDGSYGLLLKGDGRGNFQAVKAQQSGINVRGAIRDIVSLQIKKKSFSKSKTNTLTWAYLSLRSIFPSPPCSPIRPIPLRFGLFSFFLSPSIATGARTVA
jgi:hypothetical protein